MPTHTYTAWGISKAYNNLGYITFCLKEDCTKIS